MKPNKLFLNVPQVLAHRGHHWSLLQNACRSMWNCAHTAILYCFSRGHGSGMLTVDALRGVVWHPFAMAVDCLLDMLVHLHDEAEKNKKVTVTTSVKNGVFP